MEKNSVFTGIILGTLVPVLGFLLVEQIFEWLVQFNLMNYAPMDGSSRRLRTVALIAICFNLLPFRWSRLNYHDDTMRGIVFPTMAYVGLWIYRFYTDLF